MALRRAKPFRFEPRGLSDAVDGTPVFKGAMTSLQNLIPSPTTRNTFVPRPAAILLFNFGQGALQQENLDFILQESGDKILLGN